MIDLIDSFANLMISVRMKHNLGSVKYLAINELNVIKNGEQEIKLQIGALPNLITFLVTCLFAGKLIQNGI